MKLFCIKAHQQFNHTTLRAVDAFVSLWLVTFDDRNIEPVWADMIQYAEARERESSMELFSYMYMIKGNRPDCVFYIKEYKQHADKLTEMVFADHVCGIRGFETFELVPETKKSSNKTRAKN